MRCKPLIRQTLCALFLALAWIGSAHAKTCGVSGAWVNFGIYYPGASGQLTTTGSVIVECNGEIHAQLSLSVGNGAGASYSGGRKMTRPNGGGTLLYNLYADSSRNLVLGDGTGGSVKLDIRGHKRLDQPIWARVPALQRTAQAGDYTDVVMVTISY